VVLGLPLSLSLADGRAVSVPVLLARAVAARRCPSWVQWVIWLVSAPASMHS